MAQALGDAAMPQYTGRRSRQDRRGIDPHPAATRHARAEHLAVEIDLDELRYTGRTGFDLSLIHI